ncbi:MAG: hypothetical protein AAF351_01085 [Pseudomonadota bacterium]
MLLRRITQHVKDQNWFAVFLDFVIVVIGVVMGLQAQQWLVEQDRRSSEQQYLSRLHVDVSRLLETRKFYDENRRATLGLAQRALEILNSEKTILDTAACRGIAATSYTTVPPDELPTATELLSAGNLDAIRSEDVRTSLLRYMQEAATAEMLIMAQSEDNRSLPREYPDLFQLNYGPAPESLGSPDNNWINPSCHAEAMRNNHGFMVNVAQNVYIYDVYTNRAILPVSAALKRLHIALDAELGLVHPDDAEN